MLLVLDILQIKFHHLLQGLIRRFDEALRDIEPIQTHRWLEGNAMLQGALVYCLEDLLRRFRVNLE